MLIQRKTPPTATLRTGSKRGKNTLRWDKTGCRRFAANLDRLLMGDLACNPLLMLREFYLRGEEVKLSIQWLIKRLIKVGAKVATAGGGISMWRRRFRWPDITARCSGEDDETIWVDGSACGEVRSKTGTTVLFQQRDDGLPASDGVDFHAEPFSGSAGLPLDPSRVPKRSGWQDRRMIPDKCFGRQK